MILFIYHLIEKSFQMIKNSLLLLTFILAISIVAEADKILVVLDNAELKNTHSKFLSLLASPRSNKTKENTV